MEPIDSKAVWNWVISSMDKLDAAVHEDESQKSK